MKKILGLTISALIVMGLVGGGTWAYFSDPETSTGNILSAGTLDLKTDGANGVTATLLAEGLTPGDYSPSAANATIALSNSGSVNAGSLTLDVSYVESDNATLEAAISGDSDLSGDLSADGFAALLRVVTLDYDGTDLLTLVADANGNTWKDMQDVVGATANFTSLAGINASASKNFKVRVRLDTSAGNSAMADGITTTFTFTLNQQ